MRKAPSFILMSPQGGFIGAYMLWLMLRPSNLGT